MTQIELILGNRFIVGFVDHKLAVLGSCLSIGGESWKVSAVYSTEPKQRVAWWFKASRVTNDADEITF